MDGEAHRWMRARWEEEQITFLFEIGTDRRVLRQIELAMPDDRALAAADLSELLPLTRGGDYEAVAAYERLYGSVADQHVHQ